MLAAQHLLGFSRVDLRFEGVEGLAEVRGDILAALRPFEEHADVVDLSGEAVAELYVLRKTALPLKRLLRLGLVVPEIRRGDLLLQLGELAGIVGVVKDSSAYQTRV
jgi:hypothetical protein